MSFRVNTNLMAMNALRNLGATNANFSNAVTKLSTGMRINSGADDPAGLQISEGFRAQITGLGQALKNNQDATNYAKTAEGALNEVSQLLRDARALVLANGNDATLSASQKAANQNQLTSIIQSVDRIAQQTQFGEKKLLNGSAGVSAAIVTKANLESATIGGTFGSLSTPTNFTGNATLTVTTSVAAAKSTVTGMAATATNAIGVDGKLTVNGVQFAATSNMTHQQLINDMNARSADTGVTVAITGGNYVFTAVNYGTGGNNIVVTNDTANLGFAAAGSRNLASGANTVASITDGTNTWTTASGAITVDATDGRTLRDAYGNVIKLSNNGAQTTGASTISISAGTAQFQVGANVGQTVSLSLSNMGASALGIGALDITTSAGANSAMNLIDTAINTVGQVRGNIGNFQRNVLESNTRALSVARENITATESSIRDTDIAEEMTMYTKLQILQQSGLSVLAQANQAPQAVLSLLRG